MYVRVSREPGRADISFYNAPDGDTRLTNTLALMGRTASNEPGIWNTGTRKMYEGKVSLSDRKRR